LEDKYNDANGNILTAKQIL
jgi:hypothetical protein